MKSETTGQKHISTLATDIKHLISEISNKTCQHDRRKHGCILKEY